VSLFVSAEKYVFRVSEELPGIRNKSADGKRPLLSHAGGEQY